MGLMVNGLLDIPQRPMELGRIRLGEKGNRGEPVRLKTFRLTSGSKERLEAAARLYGGQVKKWDGAPDEGQWQVTTAAAEIDVLISRHIESVSQSYELWQGGTCMRRCDGVTERLTSSPCPCAAAGLQGPDKACEVITRLRVILPRVPGIGTWRLETSGWVAATTLPATLQMLAGTTEADWIPATLRAAQASRKVRESDGRVVTHRWVQPELDHPVAIGQLLQASGAIDAPQIEATVSAPPTAAQRAVARAQAVTTSAPAAGAAGATEGAPAARPVSTAPAAESADAPVPSEPSADDADIVEGEAVEVTAGPRCEGFHAELGRCTREQGHPEPGRSKAFHLDPDGRTWKDAA